MFIILALTFYLQALLIVSIPFFFRKWQDRSLRFPMMAIVYRIAKEMTVTMSHKEDIRI